MQQLILMVATTMLVNLALIFVAALLGHKLYINVRSRYDIKVNCWFCNNNTRVPYAKRNSWTCPHCDQYNGFKKDGDYNRDLNLSRGSQNNNNSNSSGSHATSTVCANAYYANGLNTTPPAPGNGLCDQCNEAQRLKVEKLAQFEPKHESRFEQELKIYQKQLEQQFRLCGSCERHVSKVLHEKKKMVLGSKFLNFIIKGAALLKQPHFKRLALVQQQRRLERYQLLMTLLTILNVIALICSLQTATQQQFSQLLGQTLGHALFFVYSHVLALLRVLSEYAGNLIASQPLLTRFMLFGSTLSKLLLYSLGLSQHQTQQATLSGCFSSFYPYAMLALCFLHSISNRLKFTRFTLLLVLWSIYAKGSMLLSEAIDGVTLLLLGSILTLALLTTNRKNSLLALGHNESVDDSFHRLYADEGISDDETISMLSQQLSCNGSSNNMSMSMGASISSLNGSPQLRARNRANIAPSVLSLDSLHLSSQRTAVPPPLASPAPSFRSAASPLSYAASCHASQSPSMWRNMNASPAYGWQRGFGGNSAMERRANTARSSQNLLFPPRLQHQQPHSGDVTAWVQATSGCQRQLNILDEPNTANLLGYCDDKQQQQQQLSRTSSQSSGFESQLGQQQNLARNEPNLRGSATHMGVGYQDFNYGFEAPSTRIHAPLLSPYSSQSEFHFDRSLQSQLPTAPAPAASQELRPGDLLRKWVHQQVGAQPTTRG